MKSLELRIPPLVVAALVAALMWLAAWITPSFAIHFPGHVPIALILAILGAVIAGSSFVSFKRARTTVNPTTPGAATSFVLSGPYRFTRNPMYLGILLILAGWSAFLSNLLAFLFFPAFVLYMNRFQIQPEESALAALFGSEFIAYKARVRRWL